MKKHILWLLILCICPFAFAQNIQISENSYEKVSVTFNTGALSVKDITLPQGSFSLISMDSYGIPDNPGAPMLPLLAKFIQTPVCDSVIATIVDAKYTDYSAAELGITHLLYPTQPSVSKSAPTPPFAYDQTIYTTDTFYALPLVSVEKTGIRRGISLATVYVSPVQYNPVTQTVRIYYQLDVEFTFVNTDMTMTHKIEKYETPMFVLDSSLVINQMENASKAEFKGAPIKYLIVANSIFSSSTDLAAFADWKRRLGYKVEVAYTSDANVGTTTTSIKNFIQNKYNNATTADPAPTFLLLIGDVAQLPAFSTQVSGESHVTDLYYATLAGNDNIPDCYYGRLSATNSSQLSNQIAKIMMYEQYTMPDPSYLGNAVLIAGTDGNGYSPTHADGQINYIYNNYIYPGSTTHSFTNVYKHNYNCSSQAATIRNEINAGVCLANYTAHGSSSGWADPGFSSSNVSSMTNSGKYGLLIGNCCLSGKFDDSECFGESLLRASNKGAMGYIGASNSSYWNEDVYWAVGVRSSINANMSYDAAKLGVYDKMFHTHGEAYSNWVSTIGGIIQGGNLAVESSNTSRKKYYWEIYHCFGDPSVRVYLGIPNTMTVTVNDITAGDNQCIVQAVPYAYVALKKSTTVFVAAAFANASGTATLSLPSDLEAGVYEVVALAQNYVWYHQNIEVMDASSCSSPNNVTFTNVTPFTANLSWTGESGGTYSIELKSGTANWATVATGITATSYTLTNLQEDMTYQVRVKRVCNDGESSGWRNATFTTPVACPVPTDLTCTGVTVNTANLSWTESGSANSWTLQYGTNSSFANGTYTQMNLSTTSVHLTNLTAETTYYARVRANCGGIYGNSQWSDVCTFLPTATETAEIGTGATTNAYLPSYSYYNYTLSQQLYTPAEIGSPGTIKSISFYNEGNEETRTYDIYLVHTNKTSFSSTSDWISVTNANKVFSGTVTMTTGAWTTLTFSTPFEYDGTSNLALIADDNTGTWTSSPHMTCQVFNSTSNCAIYKYNDNTNYNPSSMSTAGTQLSVKNHIKIEILRAAPHIIPTYVHINGNTSICPGTTTTLTATSDVEVTYAWSTGATGPQITVGAGSYSVTITSSTGDQLSQNVTVTEYQPMHTATTKSACGSYTWHGTTYTNSGNYTYNHTDTHGCTQVDTLHLTINQPTAGDTTATACESFTWNGITYTESGNYTSLKSNSAGCDSVVTLHLTINQPTTGDTTAVACETFTWNGITYTESGHYTSHKTNVAGCDSMVTLHLTINQPTTGDTTATACESFTWNGITYTESGHYTSYKTNSAGCDSVVTLHLTINQPTTGDTTATACESFTWDGTTYNESGNYTSYKTNVAGCDSVITLHLTINQPTTGDTTAVACESFTWNGTTYNESGNYTSYKTNVAGCDSVVTLHLTINQPTTGDTTAVAAKISPGTESPTRNPAIIRPISPIRPAAIVW